jgi:hypothetical protein
MSEKEMLEEHPLQLAEIKAAEEAAKAHPAKPSGDQPKH